VSAFGKTTYHLRYLTIRDADGEEHVIQTTDEHPFWVEGIGWTNAGDLKVGQTLSELDGTNDVTLKVGSKLFREMKLAKAELKLLSQGKQLCMMGRAALKLGSGGAYVAKKLNLLCFTAGTQVIVGVNPDGSYATTNIEDLRVGDRVLARDEADASDSVESREVQQVFERSATHLRYLTIRDAGGEEHVIQTTDEHPFYVPGHGWLAAGNLQAGMRLAELDGTNDATVIATHREEHPEGVTVYNLEVAGDHTYFVSDENGNAVWVHNKYSVEA
jgi:hypothetical protein